MRYFLGIFRDMCGRICGEKSENTPGRCLEGCGRWNEICIEGDDAKTVSKCCCSGRMRQGW